MNAKQIISALQPEEPVGTDLALSESIDGDFK